MAKTAPPLLAFLAAAVSALSHTGTAQAQVLTGSVFDEEGHALARAAVVVLPGGRSTLTDVSGRFRIVGLGPGEYRVEVSLIGYAPEERTVVIRSGAAAAESLVVRLRATPLTLGGIEVTASGTGRAPAAVLQATTQLSGKALERELSGTVAQTLKYQPGIAVRSNGPAAAMPIMRGLTGDRVLVLQDGQRASDLAGSASDHGVTIDPLAAQRVEVVRGPATLLYGNNAVGGVVNVISGDMNGGVPLRPQVAAALHTETAYPGGAISARATLPLRRAWAATLRGGARMSGDVRIGDDPLLGDRLRNTDTRSWNGSMAVSRTGARWSGSAGARLYDFEYGLPVPPGAEPVDLRGRRGELALRSEIMTGVALLPDARVDVTAQEYHHDELGEDGVVQQRFELGTRTAGLLVRQRSIGPLREGAWGASLLLKDYTATGPAALTPAADSRAFGVFGFQELAVSRAALQFGGRYDRYVIESHASTKFGPSVHRTFHAFSGSVGVSMPLMRGLTGAVTTSRSFRAPTVEELFSGSAHAGTGSVEYGDPLLREERGLSLETVLHLRTGRLNGQLAAFTTRLDDFIQPVFRSDTIIDGVTMPVLVYGQSPATMRGVEGALELALTRTLLLAVRGDYLHTRQQDGSALSYMPPPRAGVTVRWDDGTYSLGADVHHELTQERTGAAGEARTDAHTILRLDAAARLRLFGHVHSFTLRADNVMNTAHREATSRIRDFAPAAGRNVAVGYRVHF